ncbi:hypothetical protein ACFQV4_22785 [Streptomyces thermocarboxydus]
MKSLVPLGDGFASAATDRTVAAGGLYDRTVLWEHGNLVNAVAVLGGRAVATASATTPSGSGGCGPPTGRGLEVVRGATLLGPDESVKCVALLGDPESPVVLAGSYDFGLYRWRTDEEGRLRSGHSSTSSGRACRAWPRSTSGASPSPAGTDRSWSWNWTPTARCA